MLKLLRSQSLLMRGIAIFVPLLLANSGLFMLIHRNQLQAEKENLATRTARQIEQRKLALLGGVREVVADLNFLANHSDISTLGASLLQPPDDGETVTIFVNSLRQKLNRDFFLFVDQKKLYTMVRLIDRQGQEIVRINLNSTNERPEVTPIDELQDKSSRYYFQETIQLGKNEIFISPFDLAKDLGKVKRPFLPVIRFSTPVYSAQDDKAGILILSVFGEILLNEIDQRETGNEEEGQTNEFMLLNAEGYWLKGLTPEDEWGFMFDQGQDRTFANAYPQVWQSMQTEVTGHIETTAGLFIFSNISLLAEVQKITNQAVRGVNVDGSASYSWRIVAYVSPQTLAGLSNQIYAQLLPIYLGIVAILAIATLIILRQLQAAEKTQARIDVGVMAAEKIAAGDLTVHFDTVDTSDGLNRLFEAFEYTTQSLSKLIGQVQRSGVEVTTSSTQLASNSQQLQATMTEQVATTSEIMSTTQQIAATSEELSKNVSRVADEVATTAFTADQGLSELQQMKQTIQQLSAATAAIANRLGLISERANMINMVVTTITKVADQTNLLSLNAAIEAEKAGEYGAGFSVVAREIRRLADQTAVATLEIETMVNEMQSAVSTGVMEMDKFTQEVNQSVNSIESISQQVALVIEQVQNLTPKFAEINQGSENQSLGAQQISEAMGQLNDASQQTAKSMQDGTNTIANLQQVVQGLQQEISRFKMAQG
ncbi:methyl-accepting chemotaxis sensory transducer [Thalassoporum mexicanum PCC 7367]|uniref:methyl-accepting chemotaxis protein n=1 Tax=Thalassoporum mexicanum TaxID=3457544 RepID=UPI00029FB6D0|nr:methyl-accepting chemotaxis protein [Pseudanabaena sp. PCC 7367]AFY71599.1 methyl-accepting chemotaxis sensory transducer [Pseudanabaena sp. PCC 7367]